MSLTALQIAQLNNMSPAAAHAALGTVLGAAQAATQPASATVAGVVKQGVSVANAAGANPTQAEYDALLTSLRNAGIIAP